MERKSVYDKTNPALHRRVLARLLAEDLRRVRGGEDLLSGEVIFSPGGHIDTSLSTREGEVPQI